METILNLRAVYSKMKQKPPGQRLYQFFWGQVEIMSNAEIKEIKKIIEKEHLALVAYLDDAIAKNKISKKKAA